ncbi:MAG: DUF1800 family protein [Lewinella sp.]|nr:DUF1800 family protein [Lewinella sp.]
MLISTLPAPAVVTSIAPYTGPWTRLQAGHLLRRATFAPLKAEIDQALSLGLDGAINKLFANVALPDLPVYYDYEDNPDAGIGNTWVDLPVSETNSNDDASARRRSLDGWWMASLATDQLTIREKMCFFWHNHFGIDGPGDARAIYQFITKYRAFATGDFRELVKQMAVNPSMLVFLNGNSNTRVNPNENFAREILELFTIGKGQQIGDGDYTNYTEQDVTELARAFTGWRVRGLNTQVAGLGPESYYTTNRHDTTEKQLSHRFNNAIIENNGENEYQDVVDLIFQQDEVSRFICRKLYRYFVYYKINDAVESDIIEPMAQALRGADYVIAPALKLLLRSEHFYEASVIGDIIKSPIDVAHSIYRPTDYLNQGSVRDDYQAARRAYLAARDMGLELRRPPSVSGWSAYYQGPGFHRLWLNTATLQTRTDVQNRALSRNGWYWDGARHPFDWLTTISRYDNPGDPNDLIAEMADEFVPQALKPTQLSALKELLLPGLQDFVWTSEYADLGANPNDEALRVSVEIRLKHMVEGMLQLAEFHVH